MNHGLEPAQLIRIEEAGINASAPREQLWVDGWLVRFSPGKAKRARCVQAVAPGRLGLEARITRCLEIYERTGLRAYFRITPFSQPPDLDIRLAELGMERIDDTRVMVGPMHPAAAPDAVAAPLDIQWQPTDPAVFAEWIGAQRGSAPTERAAHARRLCDAPVPHRAVLAVDASGTPVAGGQVAIESDRAGLYNIFTVEAARGRGVANALCRHLLDLAMHEGARTAYLQVDAGNDAARRVYRRLGFVDAYAYHYRSPPAP
jgi:GNAT superfamily N-acetyltransferase